MDASTQVVDAASPAIDAGPDADAGDVPVPLAKGLCSGAGWCWQNPLPQGNSLQAAAVVGNDVWAVGNGGTVLQWDGTRWIQHPSPSTPVTNQHLFGVWGSAADNVWIVGERTMRFNGAALVDMTPSAGTFRSVWGTTASDVWLAGTFGRINHYDGVAFTPVASGTTNDLYGVSGSAANDVRFVGANGTARYWDGTTLASPPGPAGTFYALSARAANDVWAVGFNGAASRWDGTSWTSQLAPETLFSVATPPGDVVYATAAGRIYLWDGAWAKVQLDMPTTAFRGIAIHGASGWAVGDFGAMMRKTPAGFVPYSEDLCNRCNFHDLFVASPSAAYIASDRIALRWDGATWTKDVRPNAVRAVHGTSPTDVWYVGIGGHIERWDGAAYTSVPSQTTAVLNAVLALSTTNAWAAGNGVVLHWDGASWAPSTIPNATSIFTAMWGSSPTDVWAVSNNSVIRWNGTSWAEVRAQFHENVWGTGPNDVWLTGSSGVTHWNGSTFTLTGLGTNTRSIWGRSWNDVYVTTGGGLMHFDGTTWTPEAFGVSGSVIDGAGTRMWAVGSSGELLVKNL